jgi:ABC-type nitrate/sulfonate/bicarbonate transport system substrate-binding protein
MERKATILELDMVDHLTMNQTLHGMQAIQDAYPWLAKAFAVASMKAYATYLRVSFGPEEAARLLYQLADEAADRVPPSSIRTRITKGT